MPEECKECEEYQKVVGNLLDQVQKMHDERYEMLNRVYPYLANELDWYRARQENDEK